MTSSEKIPQSVDILHLKHIEIEKSIENAMSMLLTVITETNTLKQQIETSFDVLHQRIRERQKALENELNEYQNHHIHKLKTYIHQLQDQKQSLIRAQAKQQSVIIDTKLPSAQQIFILQQITNTVIKDTVIDRIQIPSLKFTVNADDVCDTISNIGAIQIIDKKSIYIDIGFDEKEAFWNEIEPLDNNECNCLKYWNINNSDMNSFLHCKTYEVITGPLIHIKNITFELILAPNGNSCRTANFVVFGVRVRSLPDTISQVTAYIVLFNKEQNYGYKRSAIFKKEDDFQFWHSKSLSLNECYNRGSLSFGCLIDILHIEHTQHVSHMNFTQHIEMNKEIDYEWHWSKYILQKLQNAYETQFFYSPNFMNDCFCVICFPKGKKTEDDGFGFKVKLLRLPFNAQGIKCNVKFEFPLIIFEDKVWAKQYVFDYGPTLNIAYIPTDLTSSQEWSELQFVKIKVHIEIVSILDHNGSEITDPTLWKAFGVNV